VHGCKDLLQGKGVTAETLCKAKSTDELGKLLSEVNVKPGHIAIVDEDVSLS